MWWDQIFIQKNPSVCQAVFILDCMLLFILRQWSSFLLLFIYAFYRRRLGSKNKCDNHKRNERSRHGRNGCCCTLGTTASAID